MLVSTPSDRLGTCAARLWPLSGHVSNLHLPVHRDFRDAVAFRLRLADLESKGAEISGSG